MIIKCVIIFFIFFRLLTEMNTPLAWPDPEIEVRYVEHPKLFWIVVKSWFLNQSNLVHCSYLLSQWVL